MPRKMPLIIAALLFSFCGLANTESGADVLVDTGPGPSSGTSYLLNSSQWGYAAKFTLTGNYKLIGVAFWMEITVAKASGEMVIYNNDGTGAYGKTVPGSKKFSIDFYADKIFPTGWCWVTLYLQNLCLSPGTYWVAFEVKDPSKFSANIYPPVPSPVPAYARSVGDHYEPAPDLNFGVRIYGDPEPLPLPCVDLLLLN